MSVAPDSVPKPRDRRRIVGYVVSVAFWMLTLPPLAAQVIYEGEGVEEVVAAHLAAIIVSLGIGALIRLVYVKARKRRFKSPWLFVLAGVIAILITVGHLSTDTVSNEASRIVFLRNQP